MHTYTPVIGTANLLYNDPYVSNNIVLILSFILSGLGGFYLSLQFLNNRVFALICGFVFAFSPYKTSHLLEHYHLLLTAAVPYFVLFVLKMIPKLSLDSLYVKYKYLALAAICGVITLFSDYYTTFFLFFFVVFLLLYLVFYKSWEGLRFYKKVWIVIGLFILGHLVVEPLHIAGKDDKGAFYNTSDITAIALPAENSMIYQAEFFDTWRSTAGFKGPNEQVMFFGFILILLSFMGKTPEHRRKHALLLFMSIVFLLLSLPKLKFLGHSLSYSPTAWFHYIPFLNNIRNPSRFIGMFYLFFPILVFARLEARQIGGKLWLPILILAITVMEYWPSKYPFINKTEAADYASFIQKEEDVKVLWQIPTGVSDGFKEVGVFDVKRLQDQIAHQKAVVGAYVSRLPDESFSDFQNESLFKITNDIALGRKIDHDLRVPAEEIQAFLDRYRVDLIVIPKHHRELYNAIVLLFKDHIEMDRSEKAKQKEVDLFYLK